MNPNNPKNSLSDENARIAIREDLRKCMLVEAAAGTGKTTMMVDRMIALLEKSECRIHELAAVTFTRKAAAELRSRFQLKLEERLRQPSVSGNRSLQNALTNIEKCFIGTIHSFCARLLRERPIEARVDIAFREIDANEDQIILDKAWDDYSSGLLAAGDPILDQLRPFGIHIRDLRQAFGLYAVMSDVKQWPSDAAVAVNFASIRGMIEEAKTHAEQITAGIPYDEQDELMRSYARITRKIECSNLDEPRELIDILVQFRRKKTPSKDAVKWLGGSKQAVAELNRWKDYYDQANTWLNRVSKAAYPFVIKALQPAAALYENRKSEKCVLNYQDLLVKAAELLRDKPHIRSYFKQRFTRLLVDEFQDTDPIQAEVMMLLTSADTQESNWEYCRPEPGSLFVVGDPKQSIYRFRRADIVTYNKVKEIIQSAGGEIVHLQSNFRSCKTVIEWVNRIFETKFQGPSEYEPEYVKLECGNLNHSSTDGVFKHSIPKIYSNKELIVEHEADRIARYILQQVQDKTPVQRKKEELDLGWPPCARFDDFLIISKKKDVLTIYSKALQRYGIPHQVTGGNSLSNTTEISLLRKLLRSVVQPADPVALVSALRSELFGISDDALFHFKQSGGEFCFFTELPVTFTHEERAFIADAFAKLKNYWSLFKALPPIVAAETALSRMGLSARAAAAPEGNSCAGSLLKVLEVLRPMQQSVLTVSDLLDQLELIMKNEEDRNGMPALEEDSPSVRVMNLHKAKGLEAPVVFLAAPCGEKDDQMIACHVDRSGKEPLGYLAIKRPDFNKPKHTPFMAMPSEWERYEESEREFLKTEGTRLLYVAATRAGRQLIITQRENRNDKNPWKSFENFLTDCNEFHVLDNLQQASGLLVDIPTNIVSDAETAIENNWKKMSVPSYRIHGVKDLTVDHSIFFGSESGRGMKWGSAIHSILAKVMADQSVDNLYGIAKSAITAAGMEPTNDLVHDAVFSINSTMTSEMWNRAVQSSKRFVEAPFAVPEQSVDENGNETQIILRGSIDLVFLENDKWVIVDYKTDSSPKDRILDLQDIYRGQVEKYAQIWERITGIQVAEKGLYFTQHGDYLVC